MLRRIVQLHLNQVSRPILPVQIHTFPPPIIPSVPLPTHFFASPILNVSLSFSSFLSNNQFIEDGEIHGARRKCGEEYKFTHDFGRKT